jgi:hypothetical protein
MFTAITATRVLLHLIPRQLGLFGVKYQPRKSSVAATTRESSEQKLFGTRT